MQLLQLLSQVSCDRTCISKIRSSLDTLLRLRSHDCSDVVDVRTHGGCKSSRSLVGLQSGGICNLLQLYFEVFMSCRQSSQRCIMIFASAGEVIAFTLMLNHLGHDLR